MVITAYGRSTFPHTYESLPMTLDAVFPPRVSQSSSDRLTLFCAVFALSTRMLRHIPAGTVHQADSL